MTTEYVSSYRLPTKAEAEVALTEYLKNPDRQSPFIKGESDLIGTGNSELHDIRVNSGSNVNPVPDGVARLREPRADDLCYSKAIRIDYLTGDNEHVFGFICLHPDTDKGFEWTAKR